MIIMNFRSNHLDLIHSFECMIDMTLEMICSISTFCFHILIFFYFQSDPYASHTWCLAKDNLELLSLSSSPQCRDCKCASPSLCMKCWGWNTNCPTCQIVTVLTELQSKPCFIFSSLGTITFSTSSMIAQEEDGLIVNLAHDNHSVRIHLITLFSKEQ